MMLSDLHAKIRTKKPSSTTSKVEDFKKLYNQRFHIALTGIEDIVCPSVFMSLNV